MPSGKTHDNITLVFLPIAASAAYVLTQRIDLTLAISGGMGMGGFLMGPDLDTRSIHYRRWGPLRFLWSPYRRLIPHRSVLSHGPIIGTLIRTVYLLVCLAALVLLGHIAIAIFSGNDIDWSVLFSYAMWRAFTLNWPNWLALLIGLELGAFFHYSADWISTTFKKRF